MTNGYLRVMEQILHSKEFYIRFSHIASVAMSTAISNAWPELGASSIKRIKSRARMKDDLLNALMIVSINGAAIGSAKAEEVIQEVVNK